MVMTGLVAGSLMQSRALAMWESPDAINSGHTVLLEVFVGLVAFALLVQALAVVVVAVGMWKAQKVVMGHIDEIKGKAMPILAKSHELLEDLKPKISAITANVEHISFVVRDKVTEFEPTISAANVTIKEANQTARDANAKAHEQIIRVNGMITSALTATSDIAEKIHHGIRVPVREITSIVSGAKATIDSLLHKTKGFGAGIKPNPARTAANGSVYGARPASSVVRPPLSVGVKEPVTAVASAAAAAFQRAEEKNLGL